MLRQHQRSLGYTCSSRSRIWQALYSSSSWTGSTLRAARTNSGALFWTSLRSHTDILQTLVIAIGLCWSIVFLVVALHFELQLYADGAMFSYADRKSTRLNSSHMSISYAVFCLKKKKKRK